jgi:hypothetical protein
MPTKIKKPSRTARQAAVQLSAFPVERLQHDLLVPETRIERDDAGRELYRTIGLRVHTQTPIDRYLSQGHVSAEQWWGGDQLRSDFERGSFELMARSRWDAQPTGGLSDFGSVSLAACAARRDYVKAIEALPGRLSPIIVHVCCLRGYAADWAISKGLPRGDGMALLRLGLDLLADHYRRIRGVTPPDPAVVRPRSRPTPEAGKRL